MKKILFTSVCTVCLVGVSAVTYGALYERGKDVPKGACLEMRCASGICMEDENLNGHCCPIDSEKPKFGAECDECGCSEGECILPAGKLAGGKCDCPGGMQLYTKKEGGKGCCDPDKLKGGVCFECTSSTDCADRSDGKNVCDTTTHTCDKGCTTSADCADRTDGKNVCDTTAHICDKGCTTNADCADRPDGRTVCDTTTHICGEGCTTNADCAGNADGKNICDTTTHTCEEGCSTDADCAGNADGKNVCDMTKHTCEAGCTTDEQCADNPEGKTHCNIYKKVCVECMNDDHCGKEKYCSSTAVCKPCTGSAPSPQQCSKCVNGGSDGVWAFDMDLDSSCSYCEKNNAPSFYLYEAHQKIGCTPGCTWSNDDVGQTYNFLYWDGSNKCYGVPAPCCGWTQGRRFTHHETFYQQKSGSSWSRGGTYTFDNFYDYENYNNFTGTCYHQYYTCDFSKATEVTTNQSTMTNNYKKTGCSATATKENC